MNIRFAILIVIAIGVAAFVALGLRSKLGNHEGGPKVLVASSAIAPGTFVRAEKHLAWADWPKNNINPSYIVLGGGHTPEEFNGAVARRGIAPGEPISPALLVKSNEGGFLSAVLTPGKRAVSVAVNATSGNAGFIFPGDHVDLLVTHDIPSKGADGQMEKSLATETFVEDVRVLAIDQMLDNPDNKAVLAKTITLEVTPEQAEAVNVAEGIGKISLTLRSLSAPEQNNGTAGATAPNAEAARPKFTRDSDVSKLLNPHGNVNSRVNVIRGGESQELEFNQAVP